MIMGLLFFFLFLLLFFYFNWGIRDTPMHTAVMLDKELYIEQLIRAGAEISIENSAGESAFLAGNKRQQNFIAKVCKQGKTFKFYLLFLSITS